MGVRTRIAPSPTGDPHVATAYTAFVNYAFAKQSGGQFILRIEDTDRVRSTAASERAILESLRWLGLNWDEGPDVGGPHGPYRQSERSAIYREYADRLLADGNAFRCYCTPERLAEMREEQRRAGRPNAYDGRCLALAPEQSAANGAAGLASVIRMKVPADGVCIVHDLLRGAIEIEWRSVDMQVLLKSDGMPTYHLANVVDDHLMAITHVIRGEEWVSSAPKHILLYRYFGWEMPQLCHLPLLRNPDKSKLSKRKNATGILFFKRMGYLPEALLNFLGLLATASAEGADEVMDLARLVEHFDLQKIALGGPVFDTVKLDWLNGRYIRERLDLDGFMARVRDWGFTDGYLRAIAPLAQSRIERLSDLGPLLAFFFAGRLDVPVERLLDGKLNRDEVRQLFTLTLAEFDTLADWQVAEIERVLRAIGDRMTRKFREIVRPLYVAVTGSPTSVPLFDAMQLLGRDLVRERLRAALTTLGTAA
ncbi:MAG: glutamate--tRNA ligase [Vulcanimicrobiaceae bacterium]